jgi:hypothetical protein
MYKETAAFDKAQAAVSLFFKERAKLRWNSGIARFLLGFAVLCSMRLETAAVKYLRSMQPTC